MGKFSNWVIASFVSLALIVSAVSTIHSINFFLLTNSWYMAMTLATAFEIGQLASLAAIVNSDKINPKISWALFIFLTVYQIMNNIYNSFEHLTINPDAYKMWTDLFALSLTDASLQKRILAIISGGFLPLLSIGFSKALVNYLKFLEKSKDFNSIKVEKVEVEPIEKVEQVEQILEQPQLLVVEDLNNEPTIIKEIKERRKKVIKPKVVSEEITEDKKEVDTVSTTIKNEPSVALNEEQIQPKVEPIIQTINEEKNVLTENDKEFLSMDKKKEFTDRVRRAVFVDTTFNDRLKAEMGGSLDFNHKDFITSLQSKLKDNLDFKTFMVENLEKIEKQIKDGI